MTNMSQLGRGTIIVVIIASCVQISVGIDNNTNVTAPETKHQSVLLLVTRPLMNITRYYCSKRLPLSDWNHSTSVIDKLMAADVNTHNSSGLHKLTKVLKRCAKYYRGDEDWAGPNIKFDIAPETTTTTKRPSKLYKLVTGGVNKVTEYAKGSFNYFKDLSTKALKAVKIMKERRKRDVSVDFEAHIIVRLLHGISSVACRPTQVYRVVEKYFQKIVELMEVAVEVKIEDDHVKQFVSVRKALEECLISPRRALWVQSAEFLGD